MLLISVIFSTGLFNAFDENCDGHVDFKELVLGIYACCRGTTPERLSCTLVSLFDVLDYLRLT